jgi:acyl-CoA thioesterase-1
MRGMLRRAFVLASLSVIVSVHVAGCSRSPRLSPIAPDATIVAFGDSLTYGTGADENDSYPAVLERLIARKVIRSGVPGEVTGGGLKRLPEVLDEHRPSLLILCLGANDVLRRMDEGALVANLRAMIGLARDRGIDVVLLAVPRPALMTPVPEFYHQLANELKLPLEADVMKKVLTDNSLKSDPIHPNAKGYARIAEAVAKLLKSSGAI